MMAKAKSTASRKSKDPEADSSQDGSVSFEQVLGELESLVEAMESDQAPLGELIENYEKGTQLYEKCQQHLDDAQRRVDLIRDGAKAGKKLESFDGNSESLERSVNSQANTKTDDGELF